MNKMSLCLILCIFAFYCSLHAQPRLEVVGGPNKNFGDIYSGSKITRNVTIKNIGTDTLNISKVAASCGCTAALASSHHIAPNDTAAITITFNSGAYRGTLTKSVNIASNDSVAPAMNVNFTVAIKTVIESTPQFLYFNKVRIDSPVTKSLRLKNTTSVSITILKATSKDSQLTVQLLQNKLKPGEETDMLTTLAPKKTGYIQGEIELKTDFEPYPVVSVGFNAQPFEVSPSAGDQSKKK